MITKFSIELPKSYRTTEVMAFNGRDRENFAEVVTAREIRKGMMSNGIPAVLSISLVGDFRADCQVDIDGELTADFRSSFLQSARNILALHIDPAPFAGLVKDDPLFGPLVRENPDLRIPQAASLFEALTWAIIGQQINLAFTITLRRNFIRLAGRQHSSGLWCYPEAAGVAGLEPAAFKGLQFSGSKAATLIRVARLMESGHLPLDDWRGKPQSMIEGDLLAVKGIGPWTVNYTLMRGFGLADCSLHGDAAVRSAVQKLTGSETKPTSAELETLLKRYQPYRSMAAAHLWASLA
jgi:DNA-3-methyladenine glycosylase II